MSLRKIALTTLFSLASVSGKGGVVINEIFYHAPDDVEDLEYVELYNPGEQPVDLGGWQLAKGARYQFPKDSRIEANGYVVLCRNLERLRETYGVEAMGSFKEPLSNKGDRIELYNAQGEKVDSVKYKDRSPWPMGPDGYSASLERICPLAPGDLAENWAASTLSKDGIKPGGTPGKKNSSFSMALPPIISEVRFSPSGPAPDQPFTVEAEVREPGELSEISLLYRVAGPGFEKEESTIAMAKVSDGRFSAEIPGQKGNQLIRFRLLAIGKNGSRRFYPGENEPRPLFSTFVHEKLEVGKIPWAMILHIDPSELEAAKKSRRAAGPGGFTEEDRLRWMAREMLQSGLDVADTWFELAMNEQLGVEELRKLQPVFAQKLSDGKKLGEETLKALDLAEKLKTIPELIKGFRLSLKEALKPVIGDDQMKKFAEWEKAALAQTASTMWGPERFLKRLINLEGAFFKLTATSDLTEPRVAALKPLFQSSLKERTDLVNRAKKAMSGEESWEDIQEKVQSLGEDVVEKIKPLLPADQRLQFESWWEEQSSFMPGRGKSRAPQPPQGHSAFIYVNEKTRELEVFDFVNIRERSGGYKVHFHDDHRLNGMTGINLIFEYNDRFVLAEPLAYELYRRAGNSAPLTDFVRLWMDGRLLGYHLLVEQPNRAFLERNKLESGGNMYKILWYEHGVIGQHEKKTNTQTGHDDIVELVKLLERTKGDEQWEAIQKNFNVEQVINYFAVNTCLSHWDGFFNNYFTYHDLNGSGKWEMYPWDQDKTWGFHDGIREGEVFYDMPLSFGMEGDVPPGWKGSRPPRGFGAGRSWWRPGGYFSKPLLANPRFREQFLARTKEILEAIYTKDVFFPIIAEVEERLKEEVRLRAVENKEDPDQAVEHLRRNLDSLREHLLKRREFLLKQDEILSAGKTSVKGDK